MWTRWRCYSQNISNSTWCCKIKKTTVIEGIPVKSAVQHSVGAVILLVTLPNYFKTITSIKEKLGSCIADDEIVLFDGQTIRVGKECSEFTKALFEPEQYLYWKKS
jgi:hypothetical protein